ncbi:MAG TPA: HAMP domain-containing sensor histidine kinase [Rhodothermales bacterium]|nr:HAMP domain-containing sensor histidine kinase [Rhodothermales bacterium]
MPNPDRLGLRRAPVWAWHLLTYALFLGLAVLAVGLYVQLVLRAEARQALEVTLARQARRVADVLEREESDRGRLEALIQTSRTLDLRFALIESDSARSDFADGKPIVRPDPETPAFAPGDSAAFRTVRDATGQRVRYAAVRLRSGEILEVGQPEPALYTLVERMRRAVLVGMAMALLVTVAGAILAAQQITRALRAIRDAAQAVADGRYDVPIPADTRAAELQDLAGSLNRMSDAFRAKIAELQHMAHIQSEFIGNVSHEVRNPIFAVGGYLEALAAPLPDAQRKRYAEKALAALGRLQALFNDLIEIARLEHRSEDLLRPSNFNLSDLLDEVCEMLRPRADEKALTLTFETPPGVYVHADRNRIRQVIVNLVENAIAYTDEGTVTARIYPRGDRVRVEVMDTGRGIPPEAQERIFERFYRVDPDRSRKSGGTGLGLSIVKQILHAHGTPIRLDSTPGKGSRFWFDLPVAPVPAPAAEAA